MRNKLETEAKLFVQEKILIGKLQLIWSHILGSHILEYENMQNPFIERRNAIIEWKKIAAENIGGAKNVVIYVAEPNYDAVREAAPAEKRRSVSIFIF